MPYWKAQSYNLYRCLEQGVLLVWISEFQLNEKITSMFFHIQATIYLSHWSKSRLTSLRFIFSDSFFFFIRLFREGAISLVYTCTCRYVSIIWGVYSPIFSYSSQMKVSKVCSFERVLSISRKGFSNNSRPTPWWK